MERGASVGSVNHWLQKNTAWVLPLSFNSTTTKWLCLCISAAAAKGGATASSRINVVVHYERLGLEWQCCIDEPRAILQLCAMVVMYMPKYVNLWLDPFFYVL